VTRCLGKRVAQRPAGLIDIKSILTPRDLIVPDDTNWYADVSAWPMMLNDTLSCCVEAGVGHSIQQRTAYAGNEIIIPDNTVKLVYAGASGWNPAQPGAGPGTFLSDMMKYWSKTGVPMPDGSINRISTYASVDHVSTAWIKTAIWKFGSVFIGLRLPLGAQDATFVFDVDPGTDLTIEQWRPGGWGEHLMLLVGYEQTALGPMFDAVTWGEQDRLTERFVLTYADEAYAVLDRDFMDARDVDPAGINWASLQTSMKALA